MRAIKNTKKLKKIGFFAGGRLIIKSQAVAHLRTESDDKSLVSYYSIKAYQVFFWIRPTLNVLTCLGLNIEYWTSPHLNYMRWLGLFTNKTFRKHKLIFPHRDFIICIVSLAIFHPHFSIRILSSAIFHPHFIIRIFLSAIRHPPSSAIRSALYRDPIEPCVGNY